MNDEQLHQLTGHCGHECVHCPSAQYKKSLGRGYGFPCDRENCPHDTRKQPSAEQRIEKAIEELEKENKDQKYLIGCTEGHHKEIHECISNTLEFAISLLRGERG